MPHPQPDSAAPADEVLVQRAAGGDEGAFAELVARYRTRVLTTAARFARDRHQLDDLGQEVFLRVYRRLHQFRGDAPFAHWLGRITTTACYDFLRRERRQREQLPLDEVVWEVPDASADHEKSALEARELLYHHLRKLTVDEQLIIILCELEEHPIAEVARLTGWSKSNVKVRAFRARARLKSLLQNEPER